MIDLHTHTTASDGQYTPSELVDIAANNGLRILAITDHDTVGGLQEGFERAGKYHIRFINGIEISTQYTDEIHILGYGVNQNNELLLKACDKFKKERNGRGKRIVDFLSSKGILINLDIVKEYAGVGNLGRPHFARYLIEYGYVADRQEAFLKYLDTPEFVEATDRKKPSCIEAIDLIHRAGGKAVLAHPGIYKMNEEKLEKLVGCLVEAGLNGIECFYSRHSPQQTALFLEWIKKYNLITSCGSDFHGEKVKPEVKIGMNFDIYRYGSWLNEI